MKKEKCTVSETDGNVETINCVLTCCFSGIRDNNLSVPIKINSHKNQTYHTQSENKFI